MEKKIKIGEREFVIKELKYKDLAASADIDKKEVGKHMMKMAIDITEEEYNDLSMKDGISLMKVINEVNGLNDPDFQ